MMTPFPPKLPMQMRLEAERRANPSRDASRPAKSIRQSARLYRPKSGDQVDAAIDWLAHLAAGRIQVS